MAGALQHAEELAPWTYGVRVLMSHDSRHLVEMSQIVYGPRAKQLWQIDRTERGMTPSALEVCRYGGRPCGFANDHLDEPSLCPPDDVDQFLELRLSP
jgi:hypothetical protein